MKKIVTLFLVLMLTVVAFAAPRSAQQALQEARNFLSSKNLQVATSLQLAHKSPRKVGASSDASYYVFNMGDDKGFVIVSGDDRTPTILGYSDKGSFDMNNLPSNIRWWMDGYAEQIAMLDNGVATARPLAPKKNAYTPKKDIPEMLTSKWNQDEPYYNLCPTDAGGQCVTGCVATAMAQVLYYHRANSTSITLAEIPSYTKYGSTTVFEGVPNESPIDWNNMLDVYTSSATEAQKTAVAQLMSYCGRSVEMSYSSSQSGAQTELLPQALVKYFGYRPETHFDYRINYNADEWDQILYNELEAGRPVLYGGNSTGGGHQFIIDGYDTDGLFHVNWGWGGMSDGYFLISVLNPENTSGIGASSTSDGYAMKQVAILGAEPAATPGTAQFTGAMIAGLNEISGNTLKYHFWNQTGRTATFYFGIAAYSEETGYTILYSSSSGSNALNVGVGYSNAGWSVTAATLSNRGLPAGTYKIVPMSRFQDEANFVPCQLDNQNIAYVSYDGTNVTFSIEYAGANLTTESIAFNGLTYVNSYVKTDIAIKNTGDKEYNGMVYLFASTTTTKGNIRSSTNIVVGANNTHNMSLTFRPTTAGTYNVWVTSDDKGNNVIGQTTVEITDGTDQYTNNSGITVASYVLESPMSGGKILGNTLKGKFTIQNTGSTKFFGNIILRLWYVDWNTNSYRSNYYEISEQNLEAGATAVIPFNFTDLDISQNYGVSLRYYTGNGAIGSINGYYTMIEPVRIFTSDGETVQAPSSTLTVPSNAMAVDISKVTGVNTINKNSNPNTLYYISSENGTLSGLSSANVIVDGAINTLTLTDGYDLYVPYTFTAQTAIYNRQMTRSTNGNGGWETLILPFEVTSVRNATDNSTIDWFHSATDTDKHFWVKKYAQQAEDGTVYFDFTDKIDANTPYIIAVPGNRWGAEWDLSGKTLQFRATDATIEASKKLKLTSPLYIFAGTMNAQTQANIYNLNAAGDNFALTSSANVAPFRAYFKSNASSNGDTTMLRIAQLGDNDNGQVTGITELNSENAASSATKWYTIDGRQLSKEPTQNGIYIRNGKKISK